ncbi:midasin-like [Ylistrum balloti]|uniref:midasin-like n=1 Tax=Ylistrum balloti TaxID=509963 RepID=UPI002905A7FA|nr:midasin-like [Ylistrum balloti]
MSTLKKKQDLLEKLARLFLDPLYTRKVCQVCRIIILDIVARAREKAEDEMLHQQGDHKNDQFGHALSMAVTQCPVLQSYTLTYLSHGGLYLTVPPKTKHKMIAESEKQRVYRLMEMIWRFVHVLERRVRDIMPVDILMSFLSYYKDEARIVWLCSDSVATMLDMTSSQRDALVCSTLNTDKNGSLSALKLQHQKWCRDCGLTDPVMDDSSVELPVETFQQSLTEIIMGLDQSDLHHSVVIVAGILLPRINITEETPCTSFLVPAESLDNNLRSLALAVSAGSPVLLQGPVGSGKTSLVEHLAQLTGRVKSPHLMKIQLGDQTDSKALLGTYRCTDIPGEFVWQAGVLTRAVTEGHWVLLEDIDSAPMDVISVLLPLLERHVLSVPGHGDNIPTAPGFQLFATQRLLGSGSGWHRQHSSSSILLEKMWTKVNVEPLSRSELEKVINTLYPQLHPVTEKLLDIYFMLSAGKHEAGVEDSLSDEVGKFLSHDGRLISTRDLMNWCRRVAADFDVSSTTTANQVLQEALDCFVACLPKPSKRLVVAEAIGAKLSISKVMAEYFCYKCKPEVKVTSTSFTCGRVQLDKKAVEVGSVLRSPHSTFSFTRQSSALLEQVSVCVGKSEPVLLVGETGTGKTSSVQFLAEQLGHTLKVINMNQQSDSSDLLGGFKPVDMKHVIRPFKEDFEILFCSTFSRKENSKFLSHIQDCFAKQKWEMLLTLMEHTLTPAIQRCKTALDLSVVVFAALDVSVVFFAALDVSVVFFAALDVSVVFFAALDVSVVFFAALDVSVVFFAALDVSVVFFAALDVSVVFFAALDVSVVFFAALDVSVVVFAALDVSVVFFAVLVVSVVFFAALDVSVVFFAALDVSVVFFAALDVSVVFFAALDVSVVFFAALDVSVVFFAALDVSVLFFAALDVSVVVFAALDVSVVFFAALDVSVLFFAALDVSVVFFAALDVSVVFFAALDVSVVFFAALDVSVVFFAVLVVSVVFFAALDVSVVVFAALDVSVVFFAALDLSVVVFAALDVSVLFFAALDVSVVFFAVLDHGKEKNIEKLDKWLDIRRRLQQLKVQIKQKENVLAFAFIEGSLVRAVRTGDWVLLDEINLAAAETLECLSGLLESTTGSVILTERGDVEQVVRHPDFRLFACMNPATDVGKKDLPTGIRNRFTELYVDEAEESQDLKILVSDYLKGLSLSGAQLDGIVKFYLTIRGQAAKHLTDGTGHKPHFSLRTLCRALRYSSKNPCGVVLRSLYEGFCLSFLTQLDRASHPMVEKLVCRHILGKVNISSILKKDIPMPGDGKYHFVEGYWIPFGAAKPIQQDKYILTPSVRANLKDLSRVVSAGQHPVLIQGETSVGKTSLVTWLAQTTGNVCVRVNNHEHTDLQEYIGSYSADQHGKLVFQEGVLVEAMRKGHWIILDELNLAPTDVLEALNRLLDDNRELFIAETEDTVKAHPKFMLFATQNPPGQYGGRKMLSRAFRNRFVELHFDQIPSKELETILHQRCDLPMSYAKRLVTTMLDLQTRRRGSGVFAGKQGFMTLRDLFRWAERYKCKNVDTQQKTFYDWDQHMADHGYMLLAGRVRRPEEVTLVLEVIQKHLKRPVDPDKLFTLGPDTSPTTKTLLKEVTQQTVSEFGHIVWTYNMKRLAVLIGQAIQFNEPVLLVGETGCGKTTVCQLYAALKKTKLRNINCHLHTESADFLGGLRPCRSHDQNKAEGELKLFEWVDGPLVLAMREGSMFLVDEISLADDSVLERLNSVLEPERTLLLAEKGGGNSHHDQVHSVVAKMGFQIFATMNPGGDFGKKELSPALRNRFTEIWCAQTEQMQDLVNIIEHNLRSGIHLCNQEDGTSGFGRAMMDFIHWFSNGDITKRCTVSIRDILSWVHFINICSRTMDEEGMETDDHSYNKLDPAVAFIHGACLVFLDGLGSGTTSRGNDCDIRHLRKISLKFLLQLVNRLTHQAYTLATLGLIDDTGHLDTDIHTRLTTTGLSKLDSAVQKTDTQFCIHPFAISRGVKSCGDPDGYALQAPTTCVNAQRILRALQLTRPLLLEGSPGVGKTSLVSAIAKAAGQELVRINLSEQTDVTDLFGADLPVEGQEGAVFAWRDGPLLQALKAGHWVILDELNLASQSVLEGLNACLDHRGEVYVPELGQTFHIQHDKTRLFACQNPLNQGGGRKGLPKSFLNRFTQVYVEPLTMADLTFISRTMYPCIPQDLLTHMVTFNMQIHEEVSVEKSWGQKGSPWEFNLRDLFRWCDLLCHNQSVSGFNPGEYVGLVYRERLRTLQDKDKVKNLYERIFPDDLPFYTPSRYVTIFDRVIQAGHSFLQCEEYMSRETTRTLYLLHHLLEPMEAVMKCVQMNWMSILVGPQSCGKSSLVQLLSSLTGHHLHVLAMNSSMDTTELLGGFEQVDIQNHVDRLIYTTESIVTDTTILLLQGQHILMAGELQQSWNRFRQTDSTELGKKLSSLEELESVKVKVTHLTEVISIVKQSLQIVTSDKGVEFLKRVSDLESEVTKMTSKLTLTSVGSGGGAFEWVDSILVQALEVGHWLLIDNVNFCSASVLDRLNALLEPNGVLNINERGVIDGAIPTIKPHPDFRLFLAMDPKFGEISRAMRNRGVEIFIAGEEDGSSYSQHDVKVMLQGQGLVNVRACDWLMSLHAAMKENISLGERPVILDLINVALVTQQQQDRGISLVKALMHASCDVYVKNIRSLVTRKVARQLWEDHCCQLSDMSSDDTVGISMTISNTKDFSEDRQLSNVKIHGQTFLGVLKRCLHFLKKREFSKLRCKMQELRHAGILFLNLSSRTQRQLHFDWLITTIKHVWPDKSCMVNVEELSALEVSTEHLVDSLQPLMTGETVVALPQYYQNDLLSCNISDLLVNGPADARWNPQAVQQFLHTCQQASDYTFMFNRFHMMQTAFIKLNSASYEALLERLRAFTKKSALGRLDHAELCDMYVLLSQKEELLKVIVSLQVSEYTDVVKVLDAVTSWCRLLEACEGSITGEEMEYHYMTLHWHMFYKRTWLLLKDRTQQQAAMALTLCELCKACDLEVETVAIVTKKKVKLLLCGGVETMMTLQRALTDVLGNTQCIDDEYQVKEKQIQATLKMFGLDKTIDDDMASDIQSQPENDMVVRSPWQHVCLWPLFEYATLVAETAIVPQLYAGDVSDGCNTFNDFCLTFTPVSPTQINKYSMLGHTNHQQICRMTLHKQLFRKTWNCTAVKHIDSWLLWGERDDQDDTSSHVKDSLCGPYSFHMATPTYTVCTFLCGGGEEKRCLGFAPSDLHCLQVSLGHWQSQAQRLALVARHLWSHGPLMSCQQYSPWFLEKQHLLEVFVFFLKSATIIVSPDMGEHSRTLVSEIQSMVMKWNQAMKHEGGGEVAIEQFLRERLELFQSCLTESLPDLACLIHRSFYSLYKVFEEPPVSLMDVGTAWLHLGLLQRRLLVPTIGVDPVEKVAVKLKYARQETSSVGMTTVSCPSSPVDDTTESDFGTSSCFTSLLASSAGPPSSVENWSSPGGPVADTGEPGSSSGSRTAVSPSSSSDSELPAVQGANKTFVSSLSESSISARAKFVFSMEGSTLLSRLSKDISSCGMYPIGNRLFLCKVLVLPSAESGSTTNTGIFGLGWLITVQASSSQRSSSLCFPSKASFFTNTRSPTLIGNPLTFRSVRSIEMRSQENLDDSVSCTWILTASMDATTHLVVGLFSNPLMSSSLNHQRKDPQGHQQLVQLADIQAELSVYDQHHLSTTGQPLSSLPDYLVHPRIPYLVAMTKHLQEKITKLELQQAYRPKPSKFKFLVNDLKDYLSSVGNEDHILQLQCRLTSVTTTTGNEFAEEKMWQKTQESFLDNLDSRYPEYRDLVTPFSLTVMLIRHGMRLVTGSAQQQLVRQQLIGQESHGNLEEKLLMMAKFPTISEAYPSNLDLVKSLISDLTSSFLLTVIQRKNTQDTKYQQKKQLISRLLHASLDLLKSDSLVRRELTPDLTFTLSVLFHQFVTSWQKQEEARREQEREEESLYRYKSKVHGDERHIDVIEEEEFRSHFPTFVNEFVDITGKDTLEESEEMETPNNVGGAEQEETTPDMITEEEMYHVYQTHHQVFTSLCQTKWLPRLPAPQVNTQDLVAPSLSTYYVGSVMATLTYDILSNKVDSQIIGGHLLATRLILEQITPSVSCGNDLERMKGKPTFDIYHDPNVSEVVQCRPVLQRLTTRVQELLSEWPDHPTLRQLTKITDRILNFPVTCPIMKFLTGLELLLEKAQEWESNAARHVSMATQLADVSLLIMQWRKLELSCWNQCLESIRRKHKCQTSRWWFHLYQLIQAFLQHRSQMLEDNQDTEPEEGESNQNEILKSLKQFMETANLGDYSVRLGMLKAFHCQLVVIETSPKQATLVSFLWNLHQFYDQFTNVVQRELDRQISPVLKELKGFVKIARWTDMNYWALKQTTEKTHRTLHKHMKSFKAILEFPIQGILKEGSANVDSVIQPSSWLNQLSEAVSSIKFTLTLQKTPDLLTFMSEELFPLQCRLLALCHKAGKHLTKYTASTGYTDYISTMDEATGEIIKTIQELQSLEVDQSAEKDKQKAEAKHIHQKKRKALADLFKHLTFIGLSYRKGLVLMNKMESQNEALMVPPVNISALVQQNTHLQLGEAMSVLGEGCGHYYNRCIARKVRFMVALQTPSNELGVGNIDRCKGFTENLFDMLIRQYRSLSNISESFCHLSELTSVLTRLDDDGSRPQPPVQQTTDWIARIKAMLVTVLEGVTQFEALLNCCPSSGNGPSPHPSPFPSSQLSQMALVCHGDQIWSEASNRVKKILCNTKDIQNKMLSVTDGAGILICCQQIGNDLKELLNQLSVLWNSETGRACSSLCGQMLVRCLPLIQHFLSIAQYNFLHQLAITRTTGKLLSTLLGVFTELTTNGFCLPAEFADEIAGEGATDFVDIEGGGMGEGEGAKDVSDQIETEDQLEDTRQQNEKKEPENHPDVASEENAIEMSEDFDANPQDLEDVDKKSEGEDEEEDDEDKLDKQMGEVDEQDADKLDDQMWGSDDDQEEEENQEDKKEESGPGAGQEAESHLVAKDDNTNKGDEDDTKNQDKKDEDETEENKDTQPHQQQEMDESEYDDDRIDPQHGNKDQQEQPEAMDLPEDLNLDDNEGEEKADGPDDDPTKQEEGKEETEFKEEITPGEEEEVEDKENQENPDDNSAEEKEEKEEDGFEESNNQNKKDMMDDPQNNPEEGKDEDVQDEDVQDGTPGFTAQDDKTEEKEEEMEENDPSTNEYEGQSTHGVENVEQSEQAQSQAGESQNDQQQSDNVGTTSTEQLEGHEGESSSKVTHGAASQDNYRPMKRKPGQSDSDRSLGSKDNRYKKLKTVEEVAQGGEEEAGETESDLYQHIKDSKSHDTQTLDTATDDQQQQQQALPNMEEEETEVTQQDEDVDMQEEETNQTEEKAPTKMSAKLNGKKEESSKGVDEDDVMETEESVKHEIDGEVAMTSMVVRGPESTIHTTDQQLHILITDFDMEKLRSELEEQLVTWFDACSLQNESVAAEAWHKYEALTASLSQELCEQLRLVLEPSQATKLKGDYRTGKRLNMRKVIPYIASQFRKDKIWLRRTKPSKRQYQIMLAIDDSSSMVDNHSKQLAYESLALIANALTLLESGELGICSFGESVRLLHPFTEQFTTQSGARLLQHFTFEQKKTKIAQLLKQMTSLMVDARSSQQGMQGNPDTSQLLLIVSDGRGLFVEGMETVRAAVRQAREARLFLVFVIIDNPENKDSILDIKVPVFKEAGQMPEIKSYMDHFPFPFYIILRDINSLPTVLCDALRQWFELVTSV